MRNWFGIFSLICAFIVSYYFYSLSIKEREPSFLVTKNVGLFSSQKGLSSEYFAFTKRSDGSEILNNVYLYEASFWNEGREPIVSADILLPITLSYADDVEIIDAFISSATRQQVIDASLNHRALEKNLYVNFRILDKMDSIGIQILYTAEKPHDFVLTGAIVGVDSIIYQGGISPQNFLVGMGKFLLMLIILFVIILFSVGVGAVFEWLMKRVPEKYKPLAQGLDKIFSLLFLAAFIIFVVYGLFSIIRGLAEDEVMKSAPRMVPLSSVEVESE